MCASYVNMEEQHTIQDKSGTASIGLTTANGLARTKRMFVLSKTS